jgi:hypothetical protein
VNREVNNVSRYGLHLNPVRRVGAIERLFACTPRGSSVRG